MQRPKKEDYLTNRMLQRTQEMAYYADLEKYCDYLESKICQGHKTYKSIFEKEEGAKAIGVQNNTANLNNLPPTI